MKVCFIGNSHLGAIKRGFDLMVKGNVDPTFFAYGGMGLSNIQASGDELVANSDRLKKGLKFTSGGHESITLREYDIVVLYGLGFYSWFPRELSRYSQRILHLSCRDNFQASLSGFVFSQVKKALSSMISGHLKVVVAASPFPSKGKASSQGDIIFHSKMAHSYYESMFKSLDCHFFYQPVDTLHGIEFTSEQYTKDSRKLETGDEDDNDLHDERDRVHMNADYGKSWCEKFFESVGDFD